MATYEVEYETWNLHGEMGYNYQTFRSLERAIEFANEKKNFGAVRMRRNNGPFEVF